MPQFPRSAIYDFWLVDDKPNFGTIPRGILPGVDTDAPIRLQRGNTDFGATHIQSKHWHWLEKNRHSAPSLVWTKLGQSGLFYSTEESEKLKLNLVQTPSALVVLRYRPGNDPFFSVVTVYPRNEKLDGTQIGRYQARPNSSALAPQFSIKEYTVPSVVYKKKRSFQNPTGS